MTKQKLNKISVASSVGGSLRLWQHKHFFNWFVFLFAFGLFANSIPNAYNLDDELVTNNHHLTSKGISSIPEIFISPYYQDVYGYSYEYRPVVLSSFAIEHQFFGDNAYVSHFFNVLFYALCCLLIFQTLLLLFKNYSPLFSVAILLIFVAHPAHTEVVCSIKNRDELLALLFSMLALRVSLKAIQTSNKWILILVPVFFALALMSKITAISFVLIIPLALIFFTEAGMGTILAIAFLLVIPSYFLLNINNGFQKILILLCVLFMVGLFYSAVNFKTVLPRIKKFFACVFAQLSNSNKKASANNLSGRSEYGFKDILTGIIPSKELLAVIPIFITGSVLLCYLAGVVYGYSLPASLGIVALLFLIWKGEEKISWWAEIMLGVSFILNFYFLSSESNHLFADSSGNTFAKFVAPYFAYQLVFGKRNLFIPYLLFFAAFNIIKIKLFNEYDSIAPVLILSFLLNRYVRYVLATILLVFIFNLFPYHNTTDVVDLLQFSSGILIMLSIHFNKNKQVLVFILAAIALAVFHFYQAPKDKNVSINKTIAKITIASNQINPNLISTKQDRPLHFVEECVSMTAPVALRAGTSFEIIFHYLQKVILPYPLSFYYGFKYIKPQKIFEPIPVVSIVVHFLLFILSLLFINKWRVFSFGLLIYLFSIAVFSNYMQFVPGMVADRFLLIPSLGWAIVLVGIIYKLFKINNDSRAVVWSSIPVNAKYVFAGVLLFYSILTFSRNFNWKNDLTLMRHDIISVEESAQAHNLLALHLMRYSESGENAAEQNELRNEALLHFKKANSIYPIFNVAYDIGRVYTSLNMTDSAIAAFKQALNIDTSFGETYRNIGDLLFAQGKFAEAIPYFEHLIKTRPSEYSGYDKLSFMYFKLNEFNKSIEVNRNATQQIPKLPDPLINIGRTYLGMKQPDSARYYLQKANILTPGNNIVQQLLQQTGTR